MPADHRAPLSALRHASLGISAALLLAIALASPASAAVVPQAATACRGLLTKAPTTNEPNNLSYKFSCSNPITAYTLIANRAASDFEVIDDFSVTADVLDASGAIAPTESWGCEGGLPGNGVNCNNNAATAMAAGHFAVGTFDTSDPYCPSIPTGSPPGTNPLPQAIVQLVVTDVTGAQNGPFRMRLDRSCPVVKPIPKKTKAKTKPKHGKGSHKGNKKSARK
jgi:hypothetical protein